MMIQAIRGYSPREIQQWIHLNGLDVNTTVLIDENIDGTIFLELEEMDFRGLGWNADVIKELINAINGLHNQGQVSSSAMNIDSGSNISENDLGCKCFGVDDENGIVYGQLLVLGYSEYRKLPSGNKCEPIGIANEKFKLKRRPSPNGLTLVAMERDQIENADEKLDFLKHVKTRECPDDTYRLLLGDNISFEYGRDDNKDLFQFGRALSMENDLTLRGSINVNDSHNVIGQLSQFACRIQCERAAPHRCFIYASGFDSNREIVVEKDDTLKISSDGFSHEGVYIRRPNTEIWEEVSVRGHLYQDRQHWRSQPSSTDDKNKKKTKKTNTTCLTLFDDEEKLNELEDGSFIAVGGIVILFQKPESIRKHEMDPRKIIENFNSMNVQCPVMLHTIQFHYIPRHEKLKRAVKRLRDCSDTGLVDGSPAQFDYVTEDRRPYVFPACGHVHGYSKSLVGKSCPLCRTSGPFVPMMFEFEPSLCWKYPTCVFNPCGHAASKEFCEKWSHVSLPLVVDPEEIRPCCPFCRSPLSEELPFNKIILQSDTQQKSPRKCRKSEVFNDKESVILNTTGILDLQIRDDTLSYIAC